VVVVTISGVCLSFLMFLDFTYFLIVLITTIVGMNIKVFEIINFRVLS